jgi:hypothetical protein
LQRNEIVLPNSNVDYLGLEGFVAFIQYASGSDIKAAVPIAEQYLVAHSHDYFSNLVMGIHYYDLHDAANACKYLLQAKKANKWDKTATKVLENIKWKASN